MTDEGQAREVVLRDGAPVQLTLDATPNAIVTGQHLRARLAITFTRLPSLNDRDHAHNSGMQAGRSYVDRWRKKAREAVIEVARAGGLPVEDYLHYFKVTKKTKRERPPESRQRLVSVFFTTPVIVRVLVWRPSDALYDVPNVDMKPIFDGFTEARLWVSDDSRYLPEVRYTFAGVDRTLAATREQRAARSAVIAKYKDKGKTPPRAPTRARFRVEFYPLTTR
jgi:hypothetical protein